MFSRMSMAGKPTPGSPGFVVVIRNVPVRSGVTHAGCTAGRAVVFGMGVGSPAARMSDNTDAMTTDIGALRETWIDCLVFYGVRQPEDSKSCMKFVGATPAR